MLSVTLKHMLFKFKVDVCAVQKFFSAKHDQAFLKTDSKLHNTSRSVRRKGDYVEGCLI